MIKLLTTENFGKGFDINYNQKKINVDVFPNNNALKISQSGSLVVNPLPKIPNYYLMNCPSWFKKVDQGDTNSLQVMHNIGIIHLNGQINQPISNAIVIATFLGNAPMPMFKQQHLIKINDSMMATILIKNYERNIYIIPHNGKTIPSGTHISLHTAVWFTT